MITDARIKDAGRKTHEDFFTIIFTSHFIARVRKGYWRVACERMPETERKLHILTPLLWPSRCVFLVLLDAQPEVLGSTFPRAPSVWCGLPYHISSLTFWESAGNCFGGFPSAPSVGCGLPYHIWSLLSGSLLATASGVSEVPLGRVWPSLPHLVSNSLGVCWQLHRGFPRAPSVGCAPLPHLVSNFLEVCWKLHRGFPRTPSVGCGLPYHIWSLLSGILLTTAWDPNSTELNNNSTPTRSPIGSLNRMFNRHQAEITVMQFRGYSLPVHDCSGTMRPSPCPIS